jgi:hypothetical protein
MRPRPCPYIFYLKIDETLKTHPRLIGVGIGIGVEKVADYLPAPRDRVVSTFHGFIEDWDESPRFLDQPLMHRQEEKPCFVFNARRRRRTKDAP